MRLKSMSSLANLDELGTTGFVMLYIGSTGSRLPPTPFLTAEDAEYAEFNFKLLVDSRFQVRDSRYQLERQ